MKQIKFYEEEKLMIELKNKSESSDFYLTRELTAKSLIEKLLDYFDVKDNTELSNHTKFFSCFYLDEKNFGNTPVCEIANLVFMPESTLARYRKLYARIIAYFLQKHCIFYITVKT